jgi:glycosyltransferase involved in cell wall biosynthesis
MSKKKILYLTRDGLLEPLGQSQILSYLVPLSKNYNFHIISFEKKVDLLDLKHFEAIKNICADNNIEWSVLKYDSEYRVISILYGFIKLFFKTFQLCKQNKFNLIHSRSYYTAFISLFIYKITNVPFLFDMRALWPEELAESGRIKKNGYAWRIVKKLENRCLKNAAAIVSLTHAAVLYLNDVFPNHDIEAKTTVIPTCANLTDFNYLDKEVSKSENKIILSCVGSVLSGWFKLDYLINSMDYILSNYSEITFEFITRDDHKIICAKIDAKNKWQDRIKFRSLSFSEMPNTLPNYSGSLFFFTPNISKLGSAPTRMAELLGCGVPVMTNSGVGDVADIVTENEIGIVIDNLDEIPACCDKFIDLIKGKVISKKCRNVALELFSLDVGVRKYTQAYESVNV